MGGEDPAHADALTESVTFTLARALSYGIMNVYAVKVAAVFMITASTLAIYTGIAAPWIAYLGYALALLLLFGGTFTDWTVLVFPLWVLLMSAYILIVLLRCRHTSRQLARFDPACAPLRQCAAV